MRPEELLGHAKDTLEHAKELIFSKIIVFALRMQFYTIILKEQAFYFRCNCRRLSGKSKYQRAVESFEC